MSTKASRKEIADHAVMVYGMRTWIANAYADISTGPPPQGQSSTQVLRACTRLVKDDSGSVDPLVSSLAQEVLHLNDKKVALAPNDEATMHLVLDLLGVHAAEPQEKDKLLSALAHYLSSHEFATDGNFRKFSKVIQEQSSSNSSPDNAPSM